MNKLFFFVFFLNCVTFTETRHTRLVDLEAHIPEYVISTKQIKIPGYPDAFNPSIVEWQGSLLLSFRTRHPRHNIACLIGLVWLDEHFNPTSDPQILPLYDEEKALRIWPQDPRFVVIHDRLYIVYAGKHGASPVDPPRRMFMAEIFYKEGIFTAQELDCFSSFEGEQPGRSSKNWVPFVFNNLLMLAPSINPHHIITPVIGTGSCLTLHKSLQWKWGELRGGTPALRIGEEYLAFFHSSKPMITVQSEGKRMTHYFMGAYTFKAYPPFEITRISECPIVGPHCYNGRAYETWKPLRVVFPCGYIFNDTTIWLVYGRQDFESWVMQIDREKFLKSLVPLSS